MPILNIHNTIAMEKRLNKRIETYVTTFKDKIKEKITALDIGDKTKLNEFIEFVYEYERLVVGKDDINNRKRVKNSIPNVNRCCAKRANGEQCTRRRKENCEFCGTHSKGTPHGLIATSDDAEKPMQKLDVFAEEIGGIVYYIDSVKNVYKTEDVMEGKINPTIIAQYVKNNGVCSIPAFGI
jgi:hypothetical protein